jgi:hypothetical protein
MEFMNTDLSKKAVVIHGATSGIGLAIPATPAHQGLRSLTWEGPPGDAEKPDCSFAISILKQRRIDSKPARFAPRVG